MWDVFVILSILPFSYAGIANYNTIPKGLNPTLYSSDDFVVQLDETTFNDTIHCTGSDCTSYLVEFYSDWCGHCRSFAPLYKSLAKDVRGWQNVVKIAAINCADSVNEVTCKANGVAYFPYIKYFPRNNTDAFAGAKLRPYPSLAEMRDQLTKVVIDDYAINRFDDWPTFDYLGDVVTYGELWNGHPTTAQHMAIVFENHPASLTGAQLLLDLHKHNDRLLARRCLKNHALVDALHITDFPSLAIFKRGEKIPVLIVELRRLLLTEIENFLTEDTDRDLQTIQFSSRKNRTNDCEADPEKCRERYYVSEVDMLKAMRFALFRESARTGGPLMGANLTAIHSFVSLLAAHFPVTTVYGNQTYLERSGRAVKVFARLRNFLEQKGLHSVVKIEDWQKEFLAAEESADNPFPVSSDWDHCRGSTGQFRGYTCGLWSTFHTLTVSAYKQAPNVADLRPLPVLQSIRDWVGSFFGCLHCRDHFLRMTTNTFKMEAQARKPEDVFLYLWKAHNIVNARLKDRDTEDPLFPKYQFPATFLCTNCTEAASANDDSLIRAFLLDYYTSIKPFTEDNQLSTLLL